MRHGAGAVAPPASPRAGAGDEGAGALAGRCQYFELDDSDVPEEVAESGAEGSSWEEERRELAASKASFQRVKQRQQLVEQSVSLLLQKLDALPGGAEDAAGCPAPGRQCLAKDETATKPLALPSPTLEVGPEEKVSVAPDDSVGKPGTSQRSLAVQRLALAGVNMHPVGRAPASPTADPAPAGLATEDASHGDPPSPHLLDKAEPASVEPSLEKPILQESVVDRKPQAVAEKLADPPPPPALPPAAPQEACLMARGTEVPACARPPRLQLSRQSTAGSVDRESPSETDWIPGSSWAPQAPRAPNLQGPGAAAAFPDASSARGAGLMGALRHIDLASPEWTTRSGAASTAHSPERSGTLYTPRWADDSPGPEAPGDFRTPMCTPLPTPLPTPPPSRRCTPPSSPRRPGGAPSSSWEGSGRGSRPPSRPPSAPPSPRAPSGNREEELVVHLGQSPADRSLLPPEEASAADAWHGWSVQASHDGFLFYHHAASGTSQWQMPRELTPVLGEWRRAGDGNGNVYWRNEVLGTSSWKDPRHTANLFQAASEGNFFFLQLYMYAGGQVDVADAQGRTALHYASGIGASHMALYLLQAKATVNSGDVEGSTPLHWACRYGHASVVHGLLESAADPDQRNLLGETPVHEAAKSGTADAVNWLILAQADATVRDQMSRTPAEVAAQCGNHDVARLLDSHASRAVAGAGQGSTEVPLPRPRQKMGSAVAAARQARRVSASEAERTRPPSAALALVRAARPLLRGLQWLANLVPKNADLGGSNGYSYDSSTGQWVLAPRRMDEDESSASDNDAWRSTHRGS